MRLKEKETGDMASLGMLGHTYAYLGLKKTEDGKRLVLYTGKVLNKEFEGEAVETVEDFYPYDGDIVYLRLELYKEKKYRFSWSADGIRYRRIGDVFTLNRATWTGAKLCLWACNRDNKISEGYGDYEFIYIEDGSRD